MNIARNTLFLFIIIMLCACNNEAEPPKEKSPANRSLTELIKKNPEDAQLLIERAAIYAKEGVYKAAIDDVQRALAIDNSDVSFYHLLSDYQMDDQQSKECIETLELAHEMFPEDIKTLLKLSEDHLILQNYEQSFLAANKVLKIDPQNAEGYFMAGMNFRDTGDTVRAISAFQECIENDPDLFDAWIIMGQIYEDMGNKKAIDYFNGAIEVAPENVNGWHSKAFYLQNNGGIEEALTIYKKINTIDKYFPQAYLNAGLLYLDMDSVTKAYDQFNILVNTSPTNYFGFYYRGIANEMMGRNSLAIEDYQTALRINPNFTRAQKAVEELSKG